MPPPSPHAPQTQNTAGTKDSHGPPSNGNSICPGSWGTVWGHTWAAQRQNRDVSSATRPRKEPAEPGISEQPLIRCLGELTQGLRGAYPRLLTPQSPTSNLPHVPNTAREPSAQSHRTSQACLQSGGMAPGAGQGSGPPGGGWGGVRGPSSPQTQRHPVGASPTQAPAPTQDTHLPHEPCFRLQQQVQNPQSITDVTPTKTGTSQWVTLPSSDGAGKDKLRLSGGRGHRHPPNAHGLDEDAGDCDGHSRHMGAPEAAPPHSHPQHL